ncbi:bifunctional lysylphosphatidylglycerol flippase/synthetase MprF [Paenibacillus sp. PR3]|uniref:Phosphatidylglycerol lysyltransferase n=1 Tax=Paenibacillus terricola TaxID=2763503 RepID=A0ABR8N3J3_9BACL|nr:bifunctional lysylphosphatidylglycerol flippase/synthetase MprF [Paenibacillus terricola]MBD3921967.1 bifunctional lysylphosphatidylglycerol flippase/synthetase MprF [Paenibacillus terricola]
MDHNETDRQREDRPLYRRGRQVIRFLIPIAVLLFLYTQTRLFIREISLPAALHTLKHIQPLDQLLMVAVCLFAIALMTLYDLLLLKWNGHKLTLLSIWKVSWIANTFNNAMGFAGFTGAGLRLTLYRKWGIQGPGWMKSILYLSLAGPIGLSLLALLLLFGVWHDQGLRIDHPWLLIAEIAIASYAILFLLLHKLPIIRAKLGLSDEGSHMRLRSPLTLIGVSVLEWAAAAFAFWTLVWLFHLPLSFRDTTGIYVTAAVAGVASFIPGGLGSFDAVMLLGLQSAGVSANQAFAIILLYRVFYYFIPWCIGLAFASTEWMPSKDKWTQAQHQLLKPAIKRWLTLWNWPSQTAFMRDISNWALGALVFIGGLVLLVSAATPGQWHRMSALEHYVTPLTMKSSHQLTVLIGLSMLIVSEGIYRRVKRAYYFTLVLLLSGSVFSILKGFDYEEALFLAVIYVLLWLSKDRFNRKQLSFHWHKTVLWAGITLIVALLYGTIGSLANNPIPSAASHLAHEHMRWLAKFALKDYELRREAVLALAASWLLLSMRWFLRPGLPPAAQPDHLELARLQELLKREDGNYLTHLLFLRDKSLMWSEDGKAVIGYGRSGKTLVALGDPIGDRDSARALVGQFRDFADRYAAVPVFYQVRAESLPLYHEYGFHFFKLGEEAVIPLADFKLSGRRKADLRAAFNRFERNGYTFQMVEPPFSPLLLMELKEVSDEWLGDRTEKGFSLGWFKETYLELAPVALLRDGDNRLAAFASMMPVYDKGRTASIDLMRHRKDLSGIMDALMVHLLQWAKDQGCSYFNLGMAPLGKVGEYTYSHGGERVARLVFLKGNHFYGFQGIRRFKDKFDPVWEPRYLAYSKKTVFAKTLFQVTRLVSRSPDDDTLKL